MVHKLRKSNVNEPPFIVGQKNVFLRRGRSSFRGSNFHQGQNTYSTKGNYKDAEFIAYFTSPMNYGR